jgi:hypothetical protein
MRTLGATGLGGFRGSSDEGRECLALGGRAAAADRGVEDRAAVGLAVARELDGHLGVSRAVVDDDAAGR